MNGSEREKKSIDFHKVYVRTHNLYSFVFIVCVGVSAAAFDFAWVQQWQCVIRKLFIKILLLLMLLPCQVFYFVDRVQTMQINRLLIVDNKIWEKPTGSPALIIFFQSCDRASLKSRVGNKRICVTTWIDIGQNVILNSNNIGWTF